MQQNKKMSRPEFLTRFTDSLFSYQYCSENQTNLVKIPLKFSVVNPGLFLDLDHTFFQCFRSGFGWIRFFFTDPDFKNPEPDQSVKTLMGSK